MSDNNELGILARRKIEAEIIKPIYDILVREIGKARAQAVIGEAIENAAIEAGKAFASKEPDGANIQSFVALQYLWEKITPSRSRCWTPMTSSITTTSTAPLRRDVPRDGPRRNWPPALLRPRRQVYRRLRAGGRADPHHHYYGGRKVLRLRYRVKKDKS